MLSWLVLGWALTLGYMPQNDGLGYDAGKVFFQTIELHATIAEHLKLWTDIETQDKPESLTAWYPSRATYGIGVELSASHIKLKIEHHCAHSVINGVYYDPFCANQTRVMVEFSSD